MSPARPSLPSTDKVWPLSDLAREFSARLEEEWSALWVRGEISGLKTHAASGHRYFTLKDSQAQFSAVMWRAKAEQSPVRPSDGQQVEALVRLVFYAPGGRLQLDVQRLRTAGRGDLMQAFLDLKERLAAEGLFDPARKRALPAYPERIGLLTAESGAALQDMLQVLRRRWPGVRCHLLPVPVQGPQAGPALAAGLARLSSWPGLHLDLIILGRGGGSFEDLFCFNDEALVRAIVSCPVPVVSAVGHEIDISLSDLAADLRAPTPSAAAELVVPDADLLIRRVDALGVRLRTACASRRNAAVLRLHAMGTHRALAEPLRRLRQARQRTDELGEMLPAELRDRLSDLGRRHAQLGQRLRVALARQQAETSARLLGWPRRLESMARRSISRAADVLKTSRTALDRETRRSMDMRRTRLRDLGERLSRLEAGRLTTWALRMGFALARDGEGRLVEGVRGLSPGCPLQLEFHDGSAEVDVRQIRETPA